MSSIIIGIDKSPHNDFAIRGLLYVDLKTLPGRITSHVKKRAGAPAHSVNSVVPQRLTR
ncbi:hypothetical protein [Acetobacter oeni]|uniref:hypothetical protein n=1 Tax=Acetobacter oeni TaxID=304077 RepID=UPI00156A6C32|nr:hypothetical protein [Acetobacter oeni]MBB3884287.1 hypothetical protein [Acetobacter oeni]NHO20264.1 hypothetical protein [Acetobacter oeni]